MCEIAFCCSRTPTVFVVSWNRGCSFWTHQFVWQVVNMGDHKSIRDREEIPCKSARSKKSRHKRQKPLRLIPGCPGSHNVPIQETINSRVLKRWVPHPPVGVFSVGSLCRKWQECSESNCRKRSGKITEALGTATQFFTMIVVCLLCSSGCGHGG